MVRRTIFERGDILHVDLNPTKGHKQQGNRFVIVLTKKEFNTLGMSMVAPITQGGDFARIKGFTVSLIGASIKTQGVVLLNQIRMLDLAARNAKKIESAPDYIIDDVLARLQALID